MTWKTKKNKEDNQLITGRMLLCAILGTDNLLICICAILFSSVGEQMNIVGSLGILLFFLLGLIDTYIVRRKIVEIEEGL